MPDENKLAAMRGLNYLHGGVRGMSIAELLEQTADKLEAEWHANEAVACRAAAEGHRAIVEKLDRARELEESAKAVTRSVQDENAALRAEVDRLKDFQLAKERTVEGLEAEVEVAKSFHDVAVKERNLERVKAFKAEAEVERLQYKVARLSESLAIQREDKAALYESGEVLKQERNEALAEVERLERVIQTRNLEIDQGVEEIERLRGVLRNIASEGCEEIGTFADHEILSDCPTRGAHYDDWCAPCRARAAIAWKEGCER